MLHLEYSSEFYIMGYRPKISDQEFAGHNEALVTSCLKGLPVRNRYRHAHGVMRCTPAVIGMFILLFRNEIREFIERIQNAKFAGLDFGLRDNIAKGRERAEEIDVSNNATKLDPASLKLIEKYPDLAVLQKFKDLELLFRRVRPLLPGEKPHRNFVEVLTVLNKLNYISGSVLGLYQSLKAARSALVHDEKKVTRVEAIELIDQIQVLADVLEHVYSQLKKRAERV